MAKISNNNLFKNCDSEFDMTTSESSSRRQNSGSWTQDVTLSSDSVRVVAESAGHAGLSDDVLKELADQTMFRLRQLIQDAYKFVLHGKRTKMLPIDIDASLRLKNLQPLYGLSISDASPFRYTSCAGREICFHEDKEINICDIVSNNLPKIPLDTSLKVHWLCIDGVQPAISDNPPPKSLDHLKQEATDPASKSFQHSHEKRYERCRNTETVCVKQLAQHELSVELQLFYKIITEACVGSDETQRAEALQSLSSDPGLHQMLPRLCNFIFEGVKVNVVQYNLALLIYLMRMVKALLDNPSLYLEKYLHEIIPSVTSCIVSRQLCARPEIDNHWALRDFASRLLALICKQFSNPTNNIQTRVTRLLVGCLDNEKAPLAAHYGAVAGLIELGHEVVRSFVLNHLLAINHRIENIISTSSTAISSSNLFSIERKSCENFKDLCKRKLVSIVCSVRHPSDTLTDYIRDYGSILGHLFYLNCSSFLHKEEVGNSITLANTRNKETATFSSSSVSTTHSLRFVSINSAVHNTSSGVNGSSWMPSVSNASTLSDRFDS